MKPKNERFNKTPHPYELTFDEKAVITEIQETPDIPFVAYVTVAADAAGSVDIADGVALSGLSIFFCANDVCAAFL